MAKVSGVLRVAYSARRSHCAALLIGREPTVQALSEQFGLFSNLTVPLRPAAYRYAVLHTFVSSHPLHLLDYCLLSNRGPTPNQSKVMPKPDTSLCDVVRTLRTAPSEYSCCPVVYRQSQCISPGIGLHSDTFDAAENMIAYHSPTEALYELSDLIYDLNLCLASSSYPYDVYPFYIWWRRITYVPECE